MPQRGGGKQYIGDLAPEVTSPDTLSANCDFLYVSGHGVTNLDGWMVVPENTFIVFIGFSGFITKVAHKAEWLIHDKTTEGYFKGMYDTYFREGGSNAKQKPYADQHVYVPGDLLPITTINFKSGIQNRWDKGIFECPVRDPSVFDIEAPENNLVYYLGEFLRKRNSEDIIEGNAIIELSKPKRPAWDTFVALSKTDKLKFLEQNPEKKELSEWFEMPSKIQYLVDVQFKSNPDNLWRRLQDGAVLSHMLTDVTRRKRYNFIIVSSCRPPVNSLVTDYGRWFKRDELKAILSAKDPRNLPEAVNTRRRFARRASFSVKPSDEICATTDDPPMNLSKTILALEKIVPLMPIGAMEDKYINKLNAMFYSENRSTRKSLQSWLKIEDISELLLNRVFYPYPILSTEKPEDELKRVAFTHLIHSIKAALGAFMVGVHFDTKTDEKRLHLLGRQVLEQAGYADRERPLNVENEKAIVAAQKAFVEDPKWTALRQPRNQFTKWKQESAYHKLMENDNEALIDILEKGLKIKNVPDLNEVQKKFNILDTKVRAFQTMLSEYFEYVQLQKNIMDMSKIVLKDKIVRIESYIHKLELPLKEANEHYEEFHRLYPTENVHLMKFLKYTLDKTEGYIKHLKEIKGSIHDRIQDLESKPVAKPQNSKVVTRKHNAQPKPTWNEKELLKWRVEWLRGERNPRRDEARLKQWAAYRSTLTPAERNAQNRNLTRRRNHH